MYYAAADLRDSFAPDPTDHAPPKRPRQPEGNLWWSVVCRAVIDAAWRPGDPSNRFNGPQMQEVSKQARRWFRAKSMEPCGWGWCIDQLGIPPGYAKRIEDCAFGRRPLVLHPLHGPFTLQGRLGRRRDGH